MADGTPGTRPVTLPGPVLVHRSAAMARILRRVNLLARRDDPVLLLGETGVGKGLLARHLHARGPRAAAPFVAVDCPAFPPGLLAAELFGHERGAFTGATSRRLGRFRAAGAGTLFLDEIGDLPREDQAVLLRTLDEGEVVPLGTDRPVRVRCRVLAATNRDLPAAIGQGAFRRDLYYRLSAFQLRIPPLRDRPEDAVAIAEATLWDPLPSRVSAPRRLGPAARSALLAHPWPGNVRELVATVRRAAVAGTAEDLSDFASFLDWRPAIPPPERRRPEGEDGLSARGAAVLETLAVAGPLSTAALSRRMGWSEKTTRTAVRELAARGLVVREGKGRASRWGLSPAPRGESRDSGS